jgi:hypothetical protein
MTAARDFRDFLNDMVHACRSIIRLVAGMSCRASTNAPSTALMRVR